MVGIRSRRTSTLAVAAMLTACGGGGAVAPSAGPSEVAPTEDVTASSSATGTPSGGGVATDAVDEVATRTFEIAVGPDWLAASADAVWVKRDDGHVDRIDPEKDQVVASIETSSALCQGVGASASAAWACTGPAGGDLVRIDAATNEVGITVEVDKVFDHGQIETGFGHVWVVSNDGADLTGVSEETNAVAVTVPLDANCAELAVGADAIWVTCRNGEVLKVDPEAAEVTQRIALDGAHAIAAGDDVWVGHTDGVARVDPATGAVTETDAMPPSRTGAIAVASDGVWVRGQDPYMQRIDPSSLAVVEVLTVEEPSPGDVLFAFGSIWTSLSEGDLVYRLATRS